MGAADAAGALLGITADWKHDPNLKTEVEVRFVAEGKNSTRVELKHRRLDLYGARGDEMRAALGRRTKVFALLMHGETEHVSQAKHGVPANMSQARLSRIRSDDQQHPRKRPLPTA